MTDVSAIFGYLYWGSVATAAMYALWTVCPTISAMVLPDASTYQQKDNLEKSIANIRYQQHRKCVDCRTRNPCNCNEYRAALISDIKRLGREATSMLSYYEENGWPGRFNDGIERRLKQFIIELAKTVEWLECEDVSVMGCFEGIDTFCAFFRCLDYEPNLQEAARLVKLRRDNPPESWPPEEKVSAWERWE